MASLFYFHDIKLFLCRLEVAALLAWYDIKLRYRRTKLGLIWMSLTVIIESLLLSLLFSNLFHENFFSYYPYVFTGRIVWQLLASILTESLNAIVASKGYILDNNLPPLIFIIRIGIRNVMIFFHSSIFALILIILSGKISYLSWHWLLLPFATFFVALAIIPYGIMLAMLGTRFRDLTFLMPYIVQILFYATPIVWKSNYLSSNYAAIVKLNPLVSMVDFLRSVFLNESISLSSVNVIMMISLLGWVAAIFTYNISKAKLCYWML